MVEKACAAEGELLKQSVWLKQWNARYFRLRGRTLCYYETRASPVARGEIPLIGATVRRVELQGPAGKPHAFVVRTAKNEEHLLSAQGPAELASWLDKIQIAIERMPAITPQALAAERNPEPVPAPAPLYSQTRAADDDDPDDGGAVLGASAGVVALSLGPKQPRQQQQQQQQQQRKPQFVPPPPPPDATDPLSYLMDVSQSSPKSSSAGNTGNASAGKAAGQPPAQAVTPSLPKPSSNASAGLAFAAASAAAAPATSTPFALAEDFSGIGLRTAVKRGESALVARILQSDPSLATYTDNVDQSVLHLAAMFKHEAIALMLVEHGADPNVADRRKETPMDLAPVSLRNKMRDKLALRRAGAPATSGKQDEHADEV
jgi:hypothetical protein